VDAAGRIAPRISVTPSRTEPITIAALLDHWPSIGGRRDRLFHVFDPWEKRCLTQTHSPRWARRRRRGGRSNRRIRHIGLAHLGVVSATGRVCLAVLVAGMD
jgi:hypothetical protein